MTELESREALVLAAARRGLSATAADRERVRLGVTSALAAGTVPDDDEGPVLEDTRGSGLLTAALGLGAAVLAGGAGYAAGHHVGFAAGAREGTVTVAAVSGAPSAPEVLERGEAGAVVSPPAPAAPPASSAAEKRRREPSTVRGEAPAADESGLDEELRTLRRVERAQRAGNPRLALALLDELDRERPRGKLLEERAAARAVAECASTFGDSRAALLTRFRARYPTSVYSPRVEAACAETERRPAGDSSAERESSR